MLEQGIFKSKLELVVEYLLTESFRTSVFIINIYMQETETSHVLMLHYGAHVEINVS
jgi:hypothetical protein